MATRGSETRTEKVFLAQNQNDYGLSPAKLRALVTCPLISADIDCKAATGTTKAVEVPAGAIVYRVAVWAKTALSSSGSPDIDVGDGDTNDLYFDGLSQLAANSLAIAPHPGGAAAAAEVGGKYYSSADTIDVIINATTDAGTIKVLVWYTVDDTDLVG